MPSNATQVRRNYTRRAEQFAASVRELRNAAGMTLQELAVRCGLAASTLSKIENGQLSPGYESLLRLADGLGVDMAELFHEGSQSEVASGRRSVTRRGQGILHATAQYRYEMLCSDLSRKQFIPLVTTITARRIDDFSRLSSHDGEEFIYVLSGEIELHTEHYQPTRLKQGDGCYFDSRMGHACISVSRADALILWMTSRADGLSRQISRSAARPRSAPKQEK